MSKLGDIVNDRWTIFKLYSQKNDLWAPDRDRILQPSDDRWDALTIELPRLRWWALMQVYVLPKWKPLHVNNVTMRYIFWKCRSLEIPWMRDERSLSSVLRTTISFKTFINIQWLPLRSHLCRTCTWAHHLSLGSSMVRTSHRSSEG